MFRSVFFAALISCIVAVSMHAQTNEFTYQGRLTDGGNAANGSFDLKFTLFNAPNALTSIGPPIERMSVSVVNGVFAVTLDFPASNFDGSDRYVEIAVKSGGGATYTDLAPRQKITSTPYALKSLASETAANATNADQLGGVAASQYLTTATGNTSFIRNSTTRQTPANINISGTASFGSHGDFGGVLSTGSNLFVGGNSTLQGNLTVNGLITGTANTFAATQFNGGNFSGALFAGSLFNSTNGFYQENVRILGTPGTNNTFAGRLSGSANTGTDNSFFGFNAGNNNTSAVNNTFVGSEAGSLNTTGDVNTFLGAAAGKNNILGHDNTFVGTAAGITNSEGNENTFVGRSAGRLNQAGDGNTFVGFEAGRANTADVNTFVGYRAGDQNTGGSSNAFFGASAGGSNSIGFHNSFFGHLAGLFNTSGSSNTFLGDGAGRKNTDGDSNTYLGRDAGNENTTGSYNVAIGYDSGSGGGEAGEDNVQIGHGTRVWFSGNNNTVLGASASIEPNAASDGTPTALTFATAIGAGAQAYYHNSIWLGRQNARDTVFVPGTLRVTNTAFVSLLRASRAVVTDSLEVALAGLGSQNVCRNSDGQLATCVSSLRFKDNIQGFRGGLDLIKGLRPITFDWKGGGMRDLGLGAEDVAAIEPLLVTYNKDGQVEGVKYDRIGVVLVNAVKEQQAQIGEQKQIIEKLANENRRQQMTIDALVKAICTRKKKASASVCKDLKQPAGEVQ